MTPDKLRQKIIDGAPVFGSWLQVSNPHIAEIMQQAAFDWCAIDLEHGCIEPGDVRSLVYPIEARNKLPFARLMSRDPVTLARLLEWGIKGFIFSRVESKEELQAIIEPTLFPPAGTRGVGYARVNGYGRNMTGYDSASEKPVLVAMIESMAGFQNIESICQTDYLDGIFIGPYDLSASLGITGQFGSAKFIDTVAAILAVSVSAGKFCGMHVLDPAREVIDQRVAEGYRFLPLSTDANIIVKGIQGIESILGPDS